MLKYPSILYWEKYTFPKKDISLLSDRHVGEAASAYETKWLFQILQQRT